MTLDQHFAAALERFAPDRMAFAEEQAPVTYGALASSVDRLAAGLRARGVGPGTVVGYSLPNCPEAIALLLALSRTRVSAVPLFPMIPDPVRAGIFAAMGCSLVLSLAPSTAGLAQAAEGMRAPYEVVDLTALESGADGGDSASGASSPEQPLLGAASSGTTGAPKSVWMTQGNVAAAVTAAADMARLGDWSDAPDFRAVMAFPLSTSGILVTLGMMFAGVSFAFSRDPSPVRYCALAEHWEAEALAAPPSYFEHILNLPPELGRPLRSVRAVLTGMDFLPASLLSRLSARFEGLDRAANGYGLVETSTVFMTWKAHERAALLQAPNVLTLCPEVGNHFEVRDDHAQPLGDDEPGLLWVRGPSVVSGYLGPASGTTGVFVDGWFCTGDMARRVDERSVELLGRQKYLIKRGGKSISPAEVEETVERCPGVRCCAVVGVKQSLYGEMIWAFVVPDRGRSVELKEVMRQCRAGLPNYMVPDQVSMVSELPRGSGAGKLDREALIRQAEAELKRIQGGTRA